MYRNITGKAIGLIAALMIIGFGAYAFAGWGMGMGSGPHHGNGWGMNNNPGQDGYGYHQGAHRGMGGRGYYGANLNDEQIAKLQGEREAFRNETQDLRQRLYEKNSALNNEFAKAQSDPEILKSLQAEISDLRSQFDQKRIDHMAKMKEIAPNAGGPGSGMGMGKGFGNRGFHRGGYGNGPGMMGQGYGGGYGNCPRF